MTVYVLFSNKLDFFFLRNQVFDNNGLKVFNPIDTERSLIERKDYVSCPKAEVET